MFRSGVGAQRALSVVSSVLVGLALAGCTQNQNRSQAVPKPSVVHAAVNTGATGVLGSATFDAPIVDPNAWSGAPIGTGSFTAATTPTSTGGPSSIAAAESQGSQTLYYVIIGDLMASSGLALAVVSDQPWVMGASTIDAVHRHVVLFDPGSGTVTAEATAGTLTLTAAGSTTGQRVTGSLSATLVSVTSQCVVDADCRQGEICDVGTCVSPPPPVCRTNADCAAGQLCQAGVCVSAPPPACRVDSDCAAGQVCVSGVCVAAPPPPACRVDADCGAGQVCVSGACYAAPPPVCRVDADCSAGEVCMSGMCVSGPPQCTSSAQCARGQVCQYGVCVYSTPATCGQMQGSGDYSASFGAVAVCSAAGNAASLANGLAALDDSNGGLELYIVDSATQTEGVVVQLGACPSAAGTLALNSGDAELYATVSNAAAGLDVFTRRTATGGSVTYTQVGASISGTLSLTFAGGGSLTGSFVVQ